MPDRDRSGDDRSGDDRLGEPTSFDGLRALVRRALDLRRRGMDADALRAADVARAALPGIDVPATSDGAETLNLLGVTYFETGYTRTAEGLYRRSLALAEALDPADDELLERLLNNLGQAAYRLGDGASARALLERAVAMAEARAPGSVDLAIALDNLGSVHAGLSELGPAEALHLRALDLFQRELGPFDGHVATAAGNLSTIYAARRQLDRAEAFRLRALDTHLRLRGPEDPEALLDLTQLVGIYLTTGDQERADRLVNRLLSMGGAAPRRSHRVLAEMLGQLAGRAFGDFRLDLAERLAARAVELLEALEGPGAPETLATIRLLGNVQRATSDLAAAERNLRRALDGYEALGRPDDVVGVTIDLGKVYRDRDAYPLAEKLLVDAVERLGRDPSPDRRQLASALGNLAELRYEAERYELADRTYAEALDAIGPPGDGGPGGGEVERPWLLHNRAMLAYHLGRSAEARELYGEARRLWAESEGPEHPFVATTLANLALVHWAEGDVDRALAAFAETAAIRDRDLRRVLAVGSERKRLAVAGDTLSDLHKVLSFHFAVAPPRADVARLAAELTLQRKGRVLDAVAHTFTRLREAPDADAEALLDRLQAVRTEITALVTPIPLTRRAAPAGATLSRLRDEEQRLETALSYRGALVDPDLAPVTLDSVRRALPDGAALVEYVRFSTFDPRRTGRKGPWTGERYAALVIRPAGTPEWFDLGPVAEVDAPVDGLRRLLRSRSSAPDDCEAKAAEVAALVIAPLGDAIDGARRLLVSPDGKLALLPFGVLRGGDGRRLADRATVSYVTNGRELQALEAAAVDAPDGPAATASGVVVVAAPDYDADGADEPVRGEPSQARPASPLAARGAFAPLPETRGEADDIRALLDGVTVLDGPAATVDAVRRVRRPAVLHVATHGFFSPLDEVDTTGGVDLLPVSGGIFVQWTQGVPVANPMFFSGLALAGANRRVAGTATGILTGQDIAGIDLLGTRLVVLSACETGLGTVKRGEEFVGLRRALSIAGAATQVTSLWRVDDRATRALMAHFYGALADGLDRAGALRLAQERVERDPAHPEWRHPFYWAAFVLAGAWAPVPGGLRRRPAADGGEPQVEGARP